MRKVVVLLTLIFGLLISSRAVFSVECQSTTSKDSGTLQEVINACNAKLGELSKQRDTLASQIEYMNTQISVTQLEINRNQSETQRLKKEIKNLSSRITELDSTTDKISDTVKLKIEQMYKRQQTGLVYTLMTANNLPKFLRSIQYLRRSQISDRELLLKLQNTKVTYEEQKDLRQVKEEELNQLTASLENYKVELASQQQAKEHLLEITENDEKRYQQILSQTRAEYEAINAIIAGSGNEEKIRDTSKGEKIAVIASAGEGATCNSSGPHLHFTIVDNGGEINPFAKLKSIDFINYAGDDFNPSGDWDWPINSPIEFNQGYGVTQAVINRWVWYPSHNGIDIYHSSLDVKSVGDGELYRGSYPGKNYFTGASCLLPYVKVIHNDGQYVTLYLHVYSQ